VRKKRKKRKRKEKRNLSKKTQTTHKQQHISQKLVSAIILLPSPPRENTHLKEKGEPGTPQDGGGELLHHPQWTDS
jgi:hypothetical protein